MAFPPGVSVAIIEAGRAFTSVGSDVSLTAKVTPVFRAAGGGAMKRIVHTATGHPMLAATEEFKAESGSVLSFAVPHVDQAGWQAPSGAAYTMWYYAVEITARVGNGRNATGHVWKQNVQPLVGQDFIDLDLIADGPTGEPVTAPQAIVTSVEGQTGAVVLGPIVGTAIDQAVADGRIPHPVVTESFPGVYDIGEGGQVYGLTPNGDLPSSTVVGLRGQFIPWDSTTVNVKNPAYGAKGDGSTDDSAAVAAAMETGKQVYFPPGTYVGTWNFNVAIPRVVGSGEGTTIIKINAGEYFVDADRIWHGSHFEGIRFQGGAGAIRNRFIGGNVTTKHIVRDCYFLDYTGAAISHNSPDMPLWVVENCVFKGANQSTTIGIALPGLADTNIVQSNEFQRNRIHVKFERGGNNAYVKNNDFIQYSAPTPGEGRTFIWVVPSTAPANHGQGFTVSDNKFGPENIGQEDHRILYADQSAGTYFGDRLPNLGADSIGKISGHTFRGNLLVGSEAGDQVPFIYSTTTDIAGLSINGLQVSSNAPSWLLQVRTPGTIYASAMNNTAIHIMRQGAAQGLKLTNQPGLLRLVDTAQVFPADGTQVQFYPGGASSVDYVNLLTNKVTIGGGFNANTGVARSNITDAEGGSDAVNIAYTSGNNVSGSLAMANFRAGEPVWVEFDVAAGDTDPLSGLRFLLTNSIAGSKGTHLDVTVNPLAGWRHYRFLTHIAYPTASVYLGIARESGATGTNVKIGRIRIYHAREPQLAPPVVTSADGTRWRVGATNDGTLTLTSL